MSQQKTLEEIVVEQADVVRHQIEEAADFAESEMDLQIEVAKALDHFSATAGLDKLKAHHNVTIGVGRPDSVYGCVFIEYKTPGRLTEDNKSPGNKEVIKQLETRPREFQKELKRDITELIGVGTDGRYFILARYRSGKWDIGQPQSLSSRVVERVLRYLVGLGTAGKPFQPDYLAGDFGAESDRKLFRAQRNGRVPYQQYILRTPKLSVTDAEGKRVFKGRNTYPLSFEMRPDERAFYEAVTAYIKSGYAIAEKLTDATQQRALGFVLTVFQKLAASSSRAIKAALTGRRMRLQDCYKKIPPPRQRELDLDERYEGEWEERNAFHTAVARFTKNEIERLDGLVVMPVKQERKLIELLKLADRIFSESKRGDREKILVFTEYRETQTMLVEALHERYGEDAVVIINGDLDIDQRRQSQRAFRDDERVRFLVSTEAGGEGINLQFGHVLINYDLPWNPMRIEQRVGRIYRYGQQKVVQIYNFRCRATVEETVYGYLEKRLERAAAALAKVTGEEPEDIIAAMLGQLEGEIDYNEIYKRTLVEGSLEQSQKEIDDGIKRAQRAYEIATQSLFRNVASYSFDRYAQHLRSGVGLAELGELAERFLKAQRRVVKRADDGSLEFLTPDEIRSRAVKERYSRATFNRELAIRDPSVEFLALGHPFVDAMLRACGDVDFGGFSAQRRVKVGGVTPRNGYQFNFVIRSRVQRPEGEEYLFDLRTVFVTDAGKIDEQAAALCASHYSEPENHVSQPRLAISDAYRLARTYLEETAEQIWDWDEDVSLLNCAKVALN